MLRVDARRALAFFLGIGLVVFLGRYLTSVVHPAAVFGSRMSRAEPLEWWKTGTIYQVYPRSFLDSTADGVGDINGVTSRLDYLQYLSVGAVWLSPFCRSPMKDFGYDVSDYRDVDPLFGTLADLDTLIAEAHKRDIKIIVDFVPNHTSDKHDWFVKSCLRQAPYDDYYIWRDGKKGPDGKPQAPNNWLSVFGGTAWRWHEGRQQFYYSAFVPEQPDLNYRNPLVVREMEDVVRFWMARGVDGMRVDALEQLFESESLEDEPRSNLPGVPQFQHESLRHVHTTALPEIGDVVRGWRKVMDEFQSKDKHPRFMVIETYEAPDVRNRFYGYGSNPFNHDLVDKLQAPLSGTKIRELVDLEYTKLPPNGWPTFVLGNHDRKRVSSKFGARYVDALNTLLLTLRGTPCTYYGEELGMEEIEVTFQQTQDPWGKNFGPDRYKEFSRDPWRSPMQWDSSKHAGFTAGSSPWLPVHPDFVTRNVKEQRASPQQTPLQLYAALARLRQDPVFQRGELVFAVTNSNVLSYVRRPVEGGGGGGGVLVVLNVGGEKVREDFSASPAVGAAMRGHVLLASCSLSAKVKGTEVKLNDLDLAPGDAMVIKLL